MGDLDVTRGAMLTLVAMLDMSDASLSRIWWSREKLAAARSVAPCTITRHVRELEAAGAIEVDRAPAFESPAKGWTRWRTNRYRFCRRRRAKRETPAPAAPVPLPVPAISTPPAQSDGSQFERTHPPPPAPDESPRRSIAEASSEQRERSTTDAQKAREELARFRSENRPSPRVVRQRAEARAGSFEV